LFGEFEEDDVENVLGEEEGDEGEIRNISFNLEYLDDGGVVEVQNKKEEKKEDANSSFENECLIY
jgi:hypothetical protein